MTGQAPKRPPPPSASGIGDARGTKKARVSSTTSAGNDALSLETDPVGASEWDAEVARLASTADRLISDINMMLRRLKFSALPIWQILLDAREIDQQIEKHDADRRNLPQDKWHKTLHEQLAQRRGVLDQRRTELVPSMVVELHKDLTSFKDEFPSILTNEQRITEIKEEIASLRQSPLSMNHLRTAIKESIATHTP